MLLGMSLVSATHYNKKDNNLCFLIFGAISFGLAVALGVMKWGGLI